jgi:photosystem II stability/assembly factor-like uncharacterized protein
LGVIWRSADGANTWQRLGTLPLASHASLLTSHPLDASLIFAATADGIEKSEDGGETWTVVTENALQAEYPFRLAINPQTPDTFYLVSWIRQRVRLGQ